MSRILHVSDGGQWAIDDLVESKQAYQPHHTFKTEYIHPRDAGEERIQNRFMQVVEEFEPDIIHFEYFRIGTQLLEAKPKLQEETISITHHNQKDKCLDWKDWQELGVDKLVTHTQAAKEKLMRLGYRNDYVDVIKHGIDLDFFKYSDDEPDDFRVGYAGRIVPWKNLGKIAQACYELDVPLYFMGKQDKPDYWHSIDDKYKNQINFSYMECEDDERWDFYQDISCYVQFAEDDYESGPLPYFEAMACGVPVITTPTGSPADLADDGEDALVVDFDDVEGLKDAIKELKENKEKRDKLRGGGWGVVKEFSEERMAWEHSKLYSRVKYDDPKVSVILPTYNREEQVKEILNGLKQQEYDNFEVVVADDGSDKPIEEFVNKFREENPSMTVKIVRTNNRDTYGLAEARNRAVCKAEGKYLLFCDSRLKPHNDAIQEFVDEAENNLAKEMRAVWYFGNKGGNKDSFVENFSFVRKDHFVQFGMFNERINKYGGMSQEIRQRWRSQGKDFKLVSSAKADEIKSASSWDSEKRREISKAKFLIKRLYE